MKKALTLILALAMLFVMTIPALAEDTTKLTIEDDGNRTYVGYQLLGLTTSLKTGAHHAAHEGNHTSDCYNYAYTVNEDYREILQVEVFNNGRNELWVETPKPATAAGVTDDQILEYLAGQKSDNGDVYLTMRLVADRLYRAIKAADIEADAKNLTGTNDSIVQGYWLFADVTNLANENEANSLVMVDTKGQEDLTIQSKTALPTVEKKVKDIDDSEDDNILNNTWHDSADHDIGDTVPFKLTGTLPSNVTNYLTYKIVFHDTLSAGLTFAPASVKVLMYDSKYKADVDTDLNDAAKDVTTSFVVKTAELADNTCTFEVTCEDVLAIEGVTKDTAFVVYYEAELNDAAVIGALGNPNQVYLEFSNDPYGTTTGKTETDKVVVFTYQLVINKTDSHGHALTGAGFTLYKKSLTSQSEDHYDIVGTVQGGVGSDLTTFIWKGLDDGDYKLVESTVPSGYNKMSDIVFSISATHKETSDDPTLDMLTGGLMGEGNKADGVFTGVIEKDIVNNTGTILPETGARGTLLLIGGGAVLAVLAAVFMITRKKMSVYAD